MEYIEGIDWEKKVRHFLKDILAIVLFGTLANVDDWVEIALFAETYQEYLKNIETIDAMGTQKEIAGKIRSKRADYVLAVKGTQRTLYWIKRIGQFMRLLWEGRSHY